MHHTLANLIKAFFPKVVHSSQMTVAFVMLTKQMSTALHRHPLFVV